MTHLLFRSVTEAESALFLRYRRTTLQQRTKLSATVKSVTGRVGGRDGAVRAGGLCAFVHVSGRSLVRKFTLSWTDVTYFLFCLYSCRSGGWKPGQTTVVRHRRTGELRAAHTPSTATYTEYTCCEWDGVSICRRIREPVDDDGDFSLQCQGQGVQEAYWFINMLGGAFLKGIHCARVLMSRGHGWLFHNPAEWRAALAAACLTFTNTECTASSTQNQRHLSCKVERGV